MSTGKHWSGSPPTAISMMRIWGVRGRGNPARNKRQSKSRNRQQLHPAVACARDGRSPRIVVWSNGASAASCARPFLGFRPICYGDAIAGSTERWYTCAMSGQSDRSGHHLHASFQPAEQPRKKGLCRGSTCRRVHRTPLYAGKSAWRKEMTYVKNLSG